MSSLGEYEDDVINACLLTAFKDDELLAGMDVHDIYILLSDMADTIDGEAETVVFDSFNIEDKGD